jgi:transposase-like protein
MWTVEPLVLSVEERDELERRVRGLTTAHRDRQRAEVVLLAADGWPGTQIAPRVGMSQQSVCKWRQQFRYGGLDGLARMLAFIEHRNQTAQPFNWVYDAKEAA